jgi:hypothetical protein
MSAESHLASLGVTMQQAHDFIFSHVNEPTTIFDVAKQYDITTAMLNEITGYSTNDISAYFANYGLNTADLDSVDLSGSTSATLVKYLAFNDSTGILSTAALRTSSGTFNPDRFPSASDGIFTPGELGTTRLGYVAATADNIESLFFGTWIHSLKAMDQSEMFEIGKIFDFVENDPDSPDLPALMDNVFSDPASNPLLSDLEIAESMSGMIGDLADNIFYSQDVELSVDMLFPLWATYTDFF